MDVEIDFHEKFVALLEREIPRKTKLADCIAESLHIEKESAYRRLRGDVHFSFEEACILSKHLSLSLDGILGTTHTQNRPFLLQLVRYPNPQEIDYRMMEDYIYALRDLRDDPTTELGIVSKMLPEIFYLKYKSITRLVFLKWFYQFENQERQKTFQEVTIDDRMGDLLWEMRELYQYMRTISIILEDDIFRQVVRDICFYREIGLIRSEDIRILQKELLEMIDDLEETASKGRNERGNKVDMYVTKTGFNSGYFFIKCREFDLCVVRSLELYELISLDSSVVAISENWTNSFKRASIRISESGEIQRKKFFNEQREAINSLTEIT